MSESPHQITDPAADIGETAPPAADDAAERLGRLEVELQEMKDRWLRSEAEMSNLRARTKREVEDARLYAVQKFAKDVAEAAENLQRGIESLPKRGDAEPEIITKLRDGFEGIERSFVALLERNGIRRWRNRKPPNIRPAPSSRPGARPGCSTAACCARRWWW